MVRSMANSSQRVVRYTGMRPVANAIGPYGAEPLDPWLTHPYRLVQTLTALCRTPP
jgi:hypothetical protein